MDHCALILNMENSFKNDKIIKISTKVLDFKYNTNTYKHYLKSTPSNFR